MVLDRVGIGIITYNQKKLVRETVQRVRQLTRYPHVDFIVADDGSADGTPAMLHEMDVPVITGPHMGVAWNKNRALYLLAQVRRCSVVILLEVDTQPNQTGWEDDWIEAARRWGHVNYAGDWLSSAFLTGRGTPGDPVMCKMASARCAAFARDALDFGGYFDSHFKGRCHQHVEHSRRLIRAGYGGTDAPVCGQERVLFALLKSQLTVHQPPSLDDEEQIKCSFGVADAANSDDNHYVPWHSDSEMLQFRSEINNAIDYYPNGFHMDGHLSVTKARPGTPLARPQGKEFQSAETARGPKRTPLTQPCELFLERRFPGTLPFKRPGRLCRSKYGRPNRG